MQQITTTADFIRAVVNTYTYVYQAMGVLKRRAFHTSPSCHRPRRLEHPLIDEQEKKQSTHTISRNTAYSTSRVRKAFGGCHRPPLQHQLHIPLRFQGIESGLIPAHCFPISIDKKLGIIPLDLSSLGPQGPQGSGCSASRTGVGR